MRLFTLAGWPDYGDVTEINSAADQMLQHRPQELWQAGQIVSDDHRNVVVRRQRLPERRELERRLECLPYSRGYVCKAGLHGPVLPFHQAAIAQFYLSVLVAKLNVDARHEHYCSCVSSASGVGQQKSRRRKTCGSGLTCHARH
jgi:hypothetical protein